MCSRTHFAGVMGDFGLDGMVVFSSLDNILVMCGLVLCLFGSESRLD